MSTTPTTFTASLRVLLAGHPYDAAIEIGYCNHHEVQYFLVLAAFDDDGDVVEDANLLAAIERKIDPGDVELACAAHRVNPSPFELESTR